MASEPFAIVPMEIIQDHRLTLVQTRVLLALRSFWNPKKPHEPVFPRHSAIAARCGYDSRKITAATNALGELGWLRKEAGSGRKATRYWLTLPAVCEREVPELGTPESGTSDLPELGTSEVPESGTPIRTDQSNRPTEPTIEGRARKPKRWTVCPEVEVLTDERLAFGLEQGLPAEAVRREWDRFRDHEFRSPKQSVDRTWRNWTRRAAESALPAVRRPSSPPRRRSADEQQADVFAEIRRELGMRSEEGLGH